jgi:hypothetical protein
MAQKKKPRGALTPARRASHAKSLMKYTDDERRAKEAEHGPVNRERFEDVMQRLIRTPRK